MARRLRRSLLSGSNYNILFGNHGKRESRAQVMAFEDTWRWDDNAAERVDAIQRAVGHPAHDAITGLHIALGNCGMIAYLSYMAEVGTDKACPKRHGQRVLALRPDGVPLLEGGDGRRSRKAELPQRDRLVLQIWGREPKETLQQET